MDRADLQSYLSRAQVDQSIFELRPDYRVLLIAIDGITPASSDIDSEARLNEAEEVARAALAERPITQLPRIASWIEAYKAFGAKPKKYRNSLEALTRRVENGLPRVNRLTDIYNAISVRRQIPFGGEDLAKYRGPPRLIRATGTEDFITTSSGQTVTEHPDKGEVVWVDDLGVTCRRWNWRQGPRTALTDETTTALFILDALDPVTEDDLNAAGDELASALRQSSPELKIAARTISKDKP